MTMKNVFKIGAADDADIVVKQATVSRYHCELRWDGGVWTVSDLDSTNGTFVDGTKINRPTKVTNANKITLGRGVPLSLPPTPAVEPTSPAAKFSVAAPISTKAKPKKKGSPLILTIVTSIISATLIGLVMLSLRNGQGTPKDGGDRNDNRSVVNQNRLENSNASLPMTSAENEAVSASIPNTTTEVSPIWAIAVESKDGKAMRLIGSAVAIAPNRLVTLASIADAIQSVKESYPQVLLVQSQQPGVQIRNIQITIHPRYTEAIAKLDAFEKDLSARVKKADPMDDPALEESLEWSEKLESIMADIAKFDCASLVTQSVLKTTVPVAAPASSAESASCRLRGYPMVLPSPEVRDNLSVFQFDNAAQCKLDTKQKQPILMAETFGLIGIPLISTVCFNDKMEFVGMCSRQEPNQNIGDKLRAQVTRLEVFW